MQDAVVQARIDAGSPLVGAQLGLTSVAKQRQMNVDRPAYGWLTADMAIDTGEVVRCERYIQPRVEPEIAFLLGADLDGPHVTAAHVLAATQAVFGAVDVLDSRYAGYRFTFNDVTADNASSAMPPHFVQVGLASSFGVHLSASGRTSDRGEIAVATRFSQIRSSMHCLCLRNPG